MIRITLASASAKAKETAQGTGRNVEALWALQHGDFYQLAYIWTST